MCRARLGVQVVLKSQIYAGGRGLGTFKNGLKGGVHMVKASEVKELAQKMLGETLVTKQTGEAGAPLPPLLKTCPIRQLIGAATRLARPTSQCHRRHARDAGKPVNTLYVARKMKLAREMYFAILLDRTTSGPLMIGCSEGGTSIEDLAEKFPEKIIKVPVDVREGITDAQAHEMAEGLAVTGDKAAAAQQIKSLYRMFVESDCTMVEARTPL